jgi:hypothetical protein
MATRWSGNQEGFMELTWMSDSDPELNANAILTGRGLCPMNSEFLIFSAVRSQ